MTVQAVAVVTVVSCVLSICGSLAIIVSLLAFPNQLKKSGHKLLFMLSIADLLTSASYMANAMYFSTDYSTAMCKGLAIVDIYFPVASFLWTDAISIFVYISVTRLRRLHRANACISEVVLFRWFHVVCWTLPAICAALVWSFQKAGAYLSNATEAGAAGNYTPTTNTGGWCWIEQQATVGETVLWELVGGKFIEIASTLVVCPVMYFLTLRNLAEIQASRRSVSDSLERLNKDSQTRITEFGRKLHAVPIIFLFVRMWGTINAAVIDFRGPPLSPGEGANSTAVNGTAGGHEVGGLAYMVAIFDPSQGLWNGLMFVFFSMEVRQLWRQALGCGGPRGGSAGGGRGPRQRGPGAAATGGGGGDDDDGSLSSDMDGFTGTEALDSMMPTESDIVFDIQNTSLAEMLSRADMSMTGVGASDMNFSASVLPADPNSQTERTPLTPKQVHKIYASI